MKAKKTKPKRDRIMYVHIQGRNIKWVESEMKRLGLPKKRGKSRFIDQLLSNARNKKAVSGARA